MEKIFKKSLALVLSAALCLTALVGCLTVSAADETTTPIYEMVGAEGKAGETVTVTANLQNIEGICAHHVKFTFAKELTVISMYDVTRDKPVKFDTDVAEGENFQFKKSIDTNTGVTTVEDVNILNFVKSDNTYDEHTPSLTLTFSVKIADGTADGNYAVNVTATAADQGEAWVNTIDFRNSNVVVKNTVAPVELEAKFNQSVSFESTLSINVYVLYNEQWASCSNLYLSAKKEDYSNGTLKYVEDKVNVESMTPVTLGGAKRYRFVFKGFDARQYGDKIEFKVHGVDADNNEIYVSSNAYTTCVLNYCASQFTKTSASVAQKTLLARVLNYGAEAQKFFGSGYRLDALVNEYESVAAYIAEYATATPRTPVSIDNKAGTGISISNTVNCTDMIELVCAVKSADVASYDINNLKFVISYGSKELVYNGSNFELKANGYYYAYCRDLKSTELSSALTIALYNGDEQISVTRTYSIESYAAGQIAKHPTETKYTDFYTAMIAYGDAAVVRFS